MRDHDYKPSLNPNDQGECVICGGGPHTRNDHNSPMARFNAAANELGLAIDKVGSDGWAKGFVRRDGLHLWTIADIRRGLGIQTAWKMGHIYVGHQPYFHRNLETALRQAVLREGPDDHPCPEAALRLLKAKY